MKKHNLNVHQELMYIAEWLKIKGHEIILLKDILCNAKYIVFTDRDFDNIVYSWTFTQIQEEGQYYIEPSVFSQCSNGNIEAWSSFILEYDRNALELLYREFLFLIYKDQFTNKTELALDEKDIEKNTIQPKYRESLLLKWAERHGFSFAL